MTSVSMTSADTDLEIKMVSRLEKRERRALTRALVRQLGPFLKQFDQIICDHTSDGMIRSQKANRKLRTFHSSLPTSMQGAFGLEIRMRRLALGLSQAQLARKVGMRRSHLSDLERGLHSPKGRIFDALQRFFNLEADLRSESPSDPYLNPRPLSEAFPTPAISK